MASKKQQETFNKNVVKAIFELGAKDQDRMYQYVIDTKHGKLYISLSTPDPTPIYSIFCMFEKIPDITKIPYPNQLNIHSGKWNFHEWDNNVCLDRFINSLKQLL